MSRSGRGMSWPVRSVAVAVRARARRLTAALLLLPLALLACAIEPEAIHTDSDECAHCSMLITDRRFAAQLLNTKGRAWKFDSIECLRGFLDAGVVAAADVHSTWVTDAAVRDWVRAEDAVFVQGAGINSPMGAGLIAFRDRGDAVLMAADAEGVVLSWTELSTQRGDDHAH